MTEEQQHHVRNGIQVCKYLCLRIQARHEKGSMTRSEAETIMDRLRLMSQCLEAENVSMPE